MSPLLLLLATATLADISRAQSEAHAASDAAYDAYFARMRQHASQMEEQQFKAMNARHAIERQKFTEKFKQFHTNSQEIAAGWKDEARSGSNSMSSPTDPFSGTQHSNAKPSNMEPICKRFAHTATMWCRGSTTDRHALKCWQYFQDCSSYIPRGDPLTPMADIYRALPAPSTPTPNQSAQEGFTQQTEQGSLLEKDEWQSADESKQNPESRVIPKQKLDAACRRVMPTARRHCHGWENTLNAVRRSCTSYLQACAHMFASSDPMYNIAQEATNRLSGSTRFTGSHSSSSSPSSTSFSSQSSPSSKSEPPPKIRPEDIEEAEKEAAKAKANLPHEGVEVLHKTCDRFTPTVRKHCNGAATEKKFESKCRAFFQDCQRFFTQQSDPLYEIAHSFDSGVGLNLGSWAVKGLPYYPINEEGAIGSGYLMNIPFGAWGGGYSDHLGVRDYWSQYQEIGANWYEGRYGYKSGWSVPLVQSLGIEGETHAVVSVPLKPGEFGKPIGVDVGGGVGPYYQQNQHVGVDWMDGQVNSNFGVGVPIAGVGVNTGVGVSFPGAGTWLG